MWTFTLCLGFYVGMDWARHSVKICGALFATIEIYENLYALWAAMVSMVNYILWLEKQVFLMYLNQRCSFIVPCTSLLSILQPNSQAVVYCYLPASMRQLEHCSTPLSNKSITFSQFWIISPNLSTVPCLVMCAAWHEAMGQAQPDMFESCEPPAQAAALALFIGKTKGAQ